MVVDVDDHWFAHFAVEHIDGIFLALDIFLDEKLAGGYHRGRKELQIALQLLLNRCDYLLQIHCGVKDANCGAMMALDRLEHIFLGWIERAVRQFGKWNGLKIKSGIAIAQQLATG